MKTAEEMIELLQLEPLPGEGGYFRETYRDPGKLTTPSGERNFSTFAYYLMTPKEFSKIHRLKSTEVWHFYAGDPFHMIQITPKGELQEFQIGFPIEKAVSTHVVVPAGNWQGAKPSAEYLECGWTLVGLTVAPGFDFEDIELKGETELSELYANLKVTIAQFV